MHNGNPAVAPLFIPNSGNSLDLSAIIDRGRDLPGSVKLTGKISDLTDPIGTPPKGSVVVLVSEMNALSAAQRGEVQFLVTRGCSINCVNDCCANEAEVREELETLGLMPAVIIQPTLNS